MPMRMDYMICMAIFGNGVLIGMETIKRHKLLILKELRLAPFVSVAGVLGTAEPSTAGRQIVSTASRPFAPRASGSGAYPKSQVIDK